MTTLQSHIPNGQHLNDQKTSSTHLSFVAKKTIANVLAQVKPTLRNRKLVDLPWTATIEQAFDLLLAEDILSVPVYQLEDDGVKKTYLTIISVLDLLKLLRRYKKDDTTRDFFHLPIREAIGQTEESARLVTVHYSDALVDVLRLFSKSGAHRVLVTDKANQGEQTPVFLSQMDIMGYLQAHNHHLGPILDTTVPDLVQQSLQRRYHSLRVDHLPPLDTVTFKTTASSVFEQMADDPCTSTLPIVDDDGYLVGDISLKDLRGLNKARFDDLGKSVLVFLKSRHGALLAPITCHHRFTLSQIMAAFVLRKTSRLWWIDQQGHVQGVVNLIDVLSLFSDYSSEPLA